MQGVARKEDSSNFIFAVCPKFILARISWLVARLFSIFERELIG